MRHVVYDMVMGYECNEKGRKYTVRRILEYDSCAFIEHSLSRQHILHIFTIPL